MRMKGGGVENPKSMRTSYSIAPNEGRPEIERSGNILQRLDLELWPNQIPGHLLVSEAPLKADAAAGPERVHSLW